MAANLFFVFELLSHAATLEAVSIQGNTGAPPRLVIKLSSSQFFGATYPQRLVSEPLLTILACLFVAKRNLAAAKMVYQKTSPELA